MAATKDTTAPKGFKRRGKRGIWWYASYHRGGRLRVSTGCLDLEDAVAWVRGRPHLTLIPIETPTFINPFQSGPFTFSERWKKDTLYKINVRCKYLGGSFTEDELNVLIRRSGGRCEVTGIPFSDSKIKSAVRKPFMPSVDRVDSRSPYSFENCRLVCLTVNIAINEWGDRVFDLIAMGRCMRKLEMLGHANHATFGESSL